MTEGVATRSLRNAEQCHRHLHGALHRSLVQVVSAQLRGTGVAIESGRGENPLPFPRSIDTGNLPGERTRKGYQPGSTSFTVSPAVSIGASTFTRARAR